jgi:hypothetical protein
MELSFKNKLSFIFQRDYVNLDFFFFNRLLLFFNWYREETDCKYCLVVFDFHLI